MHMSISTPWLCFFSAITAKVLEKKRQGKSAQDAGIELGYIISTMFDPNQTVLHIDGASSDEKAEEHGRRKEKLEKEWDALEPLVAKIEHMAAQGKKITKATWTAVENKIRRVFRLDEDDKEALAMCLGTKFRVCRCHSEADLCIARASDTVPPGSPSHVVRRVVCTNDSDVLAFGNMKQVLRVLPHSRNFGLYNISDVMAAFGFSSPSQLVTLACVSKNDFGNNLPGFGIKTNTKIIGNMEPNDDIRESVLLYCVAVEKRIGLSVDSQQFDRRIRIFCDGRDSVIDSVSSSSGITQPIVPASGSNLSGSATEDPPTTNDISILFDAPEVQLNFDDTAVPEGPCQRLESLLRRVHVARKIQKSARLESRTSRKRRNRSILRGKHYVIATESSHPPPHPKTVIGRKSSTSKTVGKDSPQTGPSSSDRDEKPKKKTKSKKGLHNARNKSKASGAQKAQPPQTDRSKANMKAKVLRRIYQTRSITIGSVEGSMLRRRMEMNRDKWHEEDKDLFAIAKGGKQTGSTITPQQAQDSLKLNFQERKQTCRQEIHELSTRPHNAALVVDELQRRAFWVAAIHISALAIPSSTDEEKKAKKNLLDGILDKPDFLVNASNMLYSGKTKAKNDETGFQAAVTSLIERPGLTPVKDMMPGFTIASITRLSEIAMVSVRACLKSHYRNVTFEATNMDEDMSDIEFFFIQNEKERLYVDFPAATMTPWGVMMSEEGLLNALWTHGTKEYLCNLVGDSTKTVKGAQAQVITNKGVLFRGLFSIGSFRDTGLQKDYNIPARHLPDTTSTCNQEANDNNTSDHSMQLDNDSQAESDSNESSRPPRRLFRPVLVTDGHFLNLCVFDTRHIRPGCKDKNANSNTGSEAVGESKDQDEDDIAELLNCVDDDLGVESPFLPAAEDDGQDNGDTDYTMEIVEENSGSISSSEHGSCNTASGQPLSHTSGAINWAQRSKDLENVTEVFRDSDVCEVFHKGPRIGIDPGIKYPITATKLDPTDHNKRHVLRVSRGFLNRPWQLFQQQVQAKKRQDKIDVLESQMPSFSRTSLEEYFNYLCRSAAPASVPQGSVVQLSSSSTSTSTSTLGNGTVLARITGFYREPWWRQGRWSMKRAQTGAMDTAIKRLIEMTGATEGAKKPADNRAVFGIGLAQFSGANSKHSKLLKRFIKKARALGHTCVGIHEYFTSAKCPRVHCSSFLLNLKSRSKYCPDCMVYLDRDAVGSENIARILDSHILHQKRPPKYMPLAPPPRAVAPASQKRALDCDDNVKISRRTRVCH